LLTETNVPKAENLKLFRRRGTKAHAIYNFPLPPLILPRDDVGKRGASAALAAHHAARADGLRVSEFYRQPRRDRDAPCRRVVCPKMKSNRLLIRWLQVGGLVSMRSLPDGGKARTS